MPSPVCTARLELVPATLPLVEAEMNSPANLGKLLEAEVETWPPPLNDENSLKWTFQKLQANPENSGFLPWYIVLIQEQKRRLVGIAGIKGPPDESGTIEVGYSVVGEFQKRGIGTEATRALIRWAFKHPAVQTVTAETFSELGPSVKVMERCGMTFLGNGSEPGTVRYGINREQFSRQQMRSSTFA